MVPEWCSWCLGLPDVVPDDPDLRDYGERADPTKCDRCGATIRPGEDIGRNCQGDYLCWRCVW
jgi:hypothetical protein